jgi:membrane protein implicated in regulation of membrane protease activity
MEQIFPWLGDWTWWILAGLLLIFELLAPGIFFMWLAAAAVLTGLAAMVFDMSWQAEFMVFAILAVVSVFAGRSLYQGRVVKPADNPYLNRRQEGYIGRRFTLKQPIVDGRGKLTIEDTVWEVEGPDMQKGTHVRITGVKDMRLIVAPAED